MLLLLPIALVRVGIFGPGLPRLFGTSGDILGGATIIAVSIVLTGLLVALATLLFVRVRTIASAVERVKEARLPIDRGVADAAAIEKLRSRTATRSNA